MNNATQAFEFQLSVGHPARCYCVSCRPTRMDSGGFRPRLVIREAMTGSVVTHMSIQVGPYADADDAVEVAHIAGKGWVQMFG